VTVYLGLGGNLGDRRRYLREALLALQSDPALGALQTSGLYQSTHVGDTPQADHLNLCVALESALSPLAILGTLHRLERAAGRRPDTHGQARTLDLDLLLHGDCVRADPRCTLPHPRLSQRRFVLEPLWELAPRLRWPGQTLSLRQLLDSPSIRRQEIKQVADPSWWKEESAARTA
jgi:2-amino-4-hydroxy-6-hydroxymethyldihydropteridine diphosphokinase